MVPENPKVKLLPKAEPKPKDPTPAEIILSLLIKASDGKIVNAFEVASSVQVLKLAYESIKSKAGNMVKGGIL